MGWSYLMETKAGGIFKNSAGRDQLSIHILDTAVIFASQNIRNGHRILRLKRISFLLPPNPSTETLTRNWPIFHEAKSEYKHRCSCWSPKIFRAFKTNGNLNSTLKIWKNNFFLSERCEELQGNFLIQFNFLTSENSTLKLFGYLRLYC